MNDVLEVKARSYTSLKVADVRKASFQRGLNWYNIYADCYHSKTDAPQMSRFFADLRGLAPTIAAMIEKDEPLKVGFLLPFMKAPKVKPVQSNE